MFNLICIKASVLLCCVSARTDKYSKKTNKQKKTTARLQLWAILSLISEDNYTLCNCIDLLSQ